MTKTHAKFATRSPLEELMSDLRKEVSAMLIEDEVKLDACSAIVAKLDNEIKTWRDVQDAGHMGFMRDCVPVGVQWDDPISEQVREHLIGRIQSKSNVSRHQLAAARLATINKMVFEFCDVPTRNYAI